MFLVVRAKGLGSKEKGGLEGEGFAHADPSNVWSIRELFVPELSRSRDYHPKWPCFVLQFT